MRKGVIEYDKEDLKVIVDNNKLNISVLDYIEIEHKYEWYLKAVRFFGNFATFEHIAVMLSEKYSRTKVFNDLNSMCEMHILRKEELGNYVYFVLTKKAQIYLKKRNNIGYIPNPSDKAVKSNLLLGDYLLNNKLNITINVRSDYENEIIGVINKFTDYEEYIKICYRFLYVEIAKITGVKVQAFNNQVALIIKEDEFVECNGKVRLIKYYDILSKLMLKNIYLINFDSKDELLTITFLIQDIDRKFLWYKNEILNIEKVLKELYFNPIKQGIKYNLIIQTDSIENKKNLVKVKDFFYDLKKRKENYIKKMTLRGLNHATLIEHYFEYIKSYPWALNDISIVEYNTVRFFETRSDKINTIDPKQINILDFN